MYKSSAFFSALNRGERSHCVPYGPVQKRRFFSKIHLAVPAETSFRKVIYVGTKRLVRKKVRRMLF